MACPCSIPRHFQGISAVRPLLLVCVASLSNARVGCNISVDELEVSSPLNLLQVGAVRLEDDANQAQTKKQNKKRAKTEHLATDEPDPGEHARAAANPADIATDVLKMLRVAADSDGEPPSAGKGPERVRELRKADTSDLWFFIQQVPQEEQLWPFWAKVGVVILIFICFEYLLDVLSWCGADGLPALVHHRHQSSLYRDAKQGTDGKADDGVARSVSVLTLNVWVNRAREYVDRQIQGIRELAPDVICLQEVFHLDVLEAYRSAFPDYCLVAFGRAHNFSAVVALIAIMLAVAATFAGSVWLVEKFTSGMWRIAWLVIVPIMIVCYSRLIRHHWTVAFLTGNRTGLVMLVRRDAFELKEHSCVMFSRCGHAADFLNVLRPRGFIHVTCGLRLPGYSDPLKLRLVTTHLNQPLEQALGDGRHRQVKEIFDKCLHDDELCLLGVDLNATPPGTKGGSDCKTYADATLEMQDAWAATNPSDPERDGLTWDQIENPMTLGPINRLFYGNASRWRCDYIFWRHRKGKTSRPDMADIQVSVRSCDMVFTGQEAVSDHFGVHCVFDIRVSDSAVVAKPP